VKSIADMGFSAEANRSGKFVGRVVEFPDLHTGAKSSRLDALDEIIALTAERISDICESIRMGQAALGRGISEAS
jgi:hypothetical protein